VSEKEQEKKRDIGKYELEEYTARRLVLQTRRRPLTAVGVLWAIFVLLALSMAPWRGGTRLLMVAAIALVLVVVSLLVVRFVPRQRRVIVDREAGECAVEQTFLLPGIAGATHIPIGSIEAVRCRPRIWLDGPGAEATRWAVELAGQENRFWRLAEGTAAEPMQEFARLVAEVSSRPLQIVKLEESPVDQ